MIYLADGRHVIEMRAVLVCSGLETPIELEERDRGDGKPSRCFFLPEIQHDQKSIRLRIDWDDIRDGDPTLDTQIFRPVPGRTKLKEVPRRTWHHTEKRTADDGSRFYEFSYDLLTVRVEAIVTTLGVGTCLDAIIEDPNPLS